MQSSSFTYSKLLPFADEMLKELVEQVPNIKFNRKHPQHMFAICLYCTMLRTAESCILLIRHNQMVVFPAVLRSLFEAHVDLINAIDDSNYYKKMHLRYLSEKRRLFINVRCNPQNPFFNLIVAGMDLDEELARLEMEIEDVKTKDIKKMDVWERFEQAKLENEYQYIYWDLCLHAHNSQAVLERRHIVRKNGDYEVALFKDETIDRNIRYFDSLLGILLNSSIKIHSYFETDAEGYFVDLKKRVKNLRSSFPKVGAQTT